MVISHESGKGHNLLLSVRDIPVTDNHVMMVTKMMTLTKPLGTHGSWNNLVKGHHLHTFVAKHEIKGWSFFSFFMRSPCMMSASYKKRNKLTRKEAQLLPVEMPIVC